MNEPTPAKKRSPLKMGCLVVVIAFFGLVAYTCVGMRRMAEEERQLGNAAVEESMQEAQRLMDDGDLEGALRRLDGVQSYRADTAMQDRFERLEERIAREYGKQKEPEVAKLLAEGKAALAAGDIEKAKSLLGQASENELRFAPSYKEANSLSTRLWVVQQNDNLKPLVVGMSDTEFDAYMESGTLPAAPYDTNPGIDKAIRTGLANAKARARAWRSEATPPTGQAAAGAPAEGLGVSIELFTGRIPLLESIKPKVIQHGAAAVHLWRNVAAVKDPNGPDFIALIDNDADSMIDMWVYYFRVFDDTMAANLREQRVMNLGGVAMKLIVVGDDMDDSRVGEIVKEFAAWSLKDLGPSAIAEHQKTFGKHPVRMRYLQLSGHAYIRFHMGSSALTLADLEKMLQP